MTADPLPLVELAPQRLLRLRVVGEPVAQGSMKCVGGRGPRAHQLVPDNKERLLPWRRQIATAARALWGDRPAYDGPVDIRVVYLFTLPASAPKSWQSHPYWRTPSHSADGDKCQRAVWDALSRDAPILTNDARCVRWSGAKQWAVDGPPGLIVEVWEA